MADQTFTTTKLGEGAKKLVRIFLLINGDEYYIDKEFNENDTDQKNCDNAMDKLMEEQKGCKTVTAARLFKYSGVPLRDNQEPLRVAPAFVNFLNVATMTILNIAVYNIDKKEEENK